jgi:phosphoribosylformylglycinamidine synthase I
MKFGVVIFPGSNCDQDMIYVLRDILKQEVVELWHKDHSLQQADFIILPGGFSYGDYLRSGAIARFSPIMNEVMEYADKGGYLFGVCNGFQILCEAGLVPGALLRNTDLKFSCKNVFIKSENNDTLITSAIPKNKALRIPIAHGEGSYHADASTLEKMTENGQVLFRYCDESGTVTPESNPNGSISNIAGVCNSQKNVFGIMPHPERAADSLLANTDGLFVFKSLLSLVTS